MVMFCRENVGRQAFRRPRRPQHRWDSRLCGRPGLSRLWPWPLSRGMGVWPRTMLGVLVVPRPCLSPSPLFEEWLKRRPIRLRSTSHTRLREAAARGPGTPPPAGLAVTRQPSGAAAAGGAPVRAEMTGALCRSTRPTSLETVRPRMEWGTSTLVTRCREMRQAAAGASGDASPAWHLTTMKWRLLAVACDDDGV